MNTPHTTAEILAADKVLATTRPDIAAALDGKGWTYFTVAAGCGHDEVVVITAQSRLGMVLSIEAATGKCVDCRKAYLRQPEVAEANYRKLLADIAMWGSE